MSTVTERRKQDIESIAALTALQQGVLFHAVERGEHDPYHYQRVFEIRGDLSVDTFERAWQAAVDRHQALRTDYIWGESDVPLQVIYKHRPVRFERLDWCERPACEQRKALERWLDEQRKAGFPLRRAADQRLRLIRVGPAQWWLAWSFHHVAMDGWSVGLVLSDVLQGYLSLERGEPRRLPAPQPFSAYLQWLGQRDHAASRRYWRHVLDGVDGLTPLPMDAAPQGRTGHAEQRLSFSPAVSQSLREQARGSGVTVNTVVQALWAWTLARHAGSDDVVFGTTVSGRSGEFPGMEGMVGLFINTLPLRVRLHAQMTVREAWQAIQQRAVENQQHEHMPLPEIQRLGRAGEGGGLFESILVFENYPVDAALRQRQEGLDIRLLPRIAEEAPTDAASDARSTSGRNNYPLSLIAVMDQCLHLTLAYRRDRFDDGAIATLLGQLEHGVTRMVEDPDQRLGRLGLRTLNGEGRIAGEPAGSASDILAMWKRHLEAEPSAIALQVGDATLTRLQADRLGNAVAQALAARGVGVESTVGLCVERSFAFAIGWLGILKAGAACVPLDPGQPVERLRQLLEDAGATVVVGALEGVDSIDPDRLTPVEAAPSMYVVPEQAAYLIYTSGSTGTPKGVVVSHGALAHYVSGVLQRLNLPADASMAMVSTTAADLGHTVLFGALCSGRTLHLLPHDHAFDPDRFAAYMARHRVGILKIVPSHLRALLQAGKPADVLPHAALILGGEATSADMAQTIRDLRPECQLFNHYGPTETAVGVLTHHASELEDGPVPTGKPLPGSHVYVLDADLNPVPAGVAGELYIGGPQVARGYLNRPGLTADRFLPDPFVAAARMYRTGDRVKEDRQGRIHYLGRADEQVKIRGYRVEPGEIAHMLRTQAGVVDAAVLVRDEKLVAYCVLTNTDPATLKAALKAQLPDHMVPAQIVPMDRLPVTPNGKLDRRALPEPVWETQGYVAPRNDTEALLAQVWQDVLGVEKVGITDNFFELGGDSILTLKVIARLKKAGCKLVPKELFAQPVLGELAQTIAAKSSGDVLGSEARADRAAPPPRADRSAPLPLSWAQQRLWFLSQLNPHSASYNIPRAVRLTGSLNGKALQQTFDTLVARHESLRTTFHPAGGRALQRIHAAAPLNIAVTDLASVDAASRDATVQGLVDEEAQAPFDLETGPLVRVRLLRLAVDDHILLVTIHHIVSDGWSMNLVVDEFARLYAGFAQGRAVQLPELPIQYADYAAWQKRWLEGGELERQLQYWKAQLGTDPVVLELPVDRPRPALPSHRGGAVPFSLDGPLAARLRALARRADATVFTVLLAAFQALLYRHTGQRDLRVGVPVANRGRVETEGVVGLFINTQVLRTEITGSEPFAALLGRVRETVLHAQANQDLPFERLVEALQPERSLSHNPLFQVMVNHQRRDRGVARRLPGLELAPVERTVRSTKMDLSLDTQEDDDGTIVGVLGYAADLFDHSRIEGMLRDYLGILESVCEPTGPDTPVGLLALHGSGQRRGMFGEAAAGAVDVLTAWKRNLADEPSAIALQVGDATLTRLQVDRLANAVAQALAARGVGVESTVGLCVERSFAFAIGWLGILKAGAACVPLDPGQPVERLRQLLEDAGATVVVGALEGVDSIDPDHLSPAETAPEANVLPDQAAYLIYTSGSTGTPKGVVVSHGALAHYVSGVLQRLNLPADASMAMVSTTAADLGHTVLFGALYSGRTLHLLPQDHAFDPDRFAAYMARHRVGVLKIVPSHLRALLQARQPADVLPHAALILGGEATSADLAQTIRSLRPDCQLFNHYGPTETTVGVLTHHAAAFEDGPLPTGKPLPGSHVYVLDADLNPVPAGVAGELYIGGPQVARGYLNRPGLTAERFLPDPFVSGARMYRTGDRVKEDRQGRIHYLGRADEQVKIRGYRVEPGEIAHVLRTQAGVVDAAVVVRDDKLVAYCVLANTNPATLKAALKAQLPDHMVPAQIVPMDRLPVTPNGKLDRRALPEPVWETQGYVAPRNDSEALLAQVWQDVLGVEKVGITDNFFDLGGHSLLCLQVLSRVRAASAGGLALELRHLMQYPTVAGLAAAMEGGIGARHEALPLNRRSDTLPALFCVHASFGNVFDYTPLARALDGSCTVYGLPCPAPDAFASLEALAHLHVKAVRAVQPGGPYRLLGWSLGGALAARMAAILEDAGETVAFLGLVDTFVPKPAGTTVRQRGSIEELREYLLQALPGLDAAGFAREVELAQADLQGSALVERLIRRAFALAGSETQAGGPDELSRMFATAQRLRSLGGDFVLQPVQAAPACWWTADRDAADTARLHRMLEREPAYDARLAASHLGIVRAEAFIDAVRGLLSATPALG